MTNDTKSDIVFDANSGISEEEQRDILAKINGIAESQKRSLSEGTEQSTMQGFNAQKSGRLFPVLVNIAAIALLAGGFAVLFVIQGKTDAQVREGSRIYNSAERALIEEIRNEIIRLREITAALLEEKENEIAQWTSRLRDIDNELRALHSGNQELTAEQRAAESRLLALQNDYRLELENLQRERALILEESRAREATLQAQLASRTRDLAVVAQQGATAVELALNEINRLSGEQSQTAVIESQLGVLFANLNNQIFNYRIDEAEETINTIRLYMNTPAFQSLRFMTERKELYTQSLNTFETVLEETRRNLAGEGSIDRSIEQTLADLQARHAQLEQDLAERDREIAASSSQGTRANRRVVDLERNITDLQNRNTSLEASSAQKDRTIATLESNSAQKDRTIATLESNSAQMDSRIAALESSLNNELQNVHRLQETESSLQNQVSALNQTVAARDGSISQLQQQNAALSSTNESLNAQLAQIRQALQALSQ